MNFDWNLDLGFGFRKSWPFGSAKPTALGPPNLRDRNVMENLSAFFFFSSRFLSIFHMEITLKTVALEEFFVVEVLRAIEQNHEPCIG